MIEAVRLSVGDPRQTRQPGCRARRGVTCGVAHDEDAVHAHRLLALRINAQVEERRDFARLQRSELRIELGKPGAAAREQVGAEGSAVEGVGCELHDDLAGDRVRAGRAAGREFGRVGPCRRGDDEGEQGGAGRHPKNELHGESLLLQFPGNLRRERGGTAPSGGRASRPARDDYTGAGSARHAENGCATGQAKGPSERLVGPGAHGYYAPRHARATAPGVRPWPAARRLRRYSVERGRGQSDMSQTGQLILLVIGFSVFGLLFAAYLARWVLRHRPAARRCRRSPNAIKEGAEAFLRRQNRTILMLAVVFAVLLFVGYGFIRGHRDFDPVSSGMKLAFWITLSFVFGALCSVFAGYVGMWISIRSNIRTAHAALTSLNDALRIALRGGAVSGLLVVAMSLLGVAGLYALVNAFSSVETRPKIPLLIVGYGFGASFVALFAQLGGGIYTKAADVGADLVGKVEAGIPEDDPRNPAVIADLVGDNVGDCAGRGADLFESTAAENIGAMILGASLAAGRRQGRAWASPPGIIGVMMFPLVARAFGIIASIIGIMFVQHGQGREDGPDDRR